eukprot:403377269
MEAKNNIQSQQFHPFTKIYKLDTNSTMFNLNSFKPEDFNFFIPGEKLIQGKEAFILGSHQDERRTPVKPDPETQKRKGYRSMQGQVFSFFGNNPFKGSGTLTRDEFGNIFVITAAHNYMQVFDDLEFKAIEADGMLFDLGKDGVDKNIMRFMIQQIAVHPFYRKNSHFNCGYDIAIGKLDIENPDELAHLISDDSWWSNIDEVELKQGDEICVIGYPGEYDSELYEMKGTLTEIRRNRDGNRILVYNNIDTTKGQSGGAIYALKAGINIRIGVHVGNDKGLRANIGTAITPEIDDWIAKTIQILYPRV